MEKIEIDKDKELQPGDMIEMHFKTVGMVWLKAAQIAMIEWRMKDREEFTILSHSQPNKNTIIFTIRINKTNPIVTTALYIAGAITLAGIVWLTLVKVYQFLQSSALEIFMGAIGAVVMAIVVAFGLSLLPGGKK